MRYRVTGLAARTGSEVEVFIDAEAEAEAVEIAKQTHEIFPQSARRGFRCPYCDSPVMPVTRSKISTGGWIVFAVMLLLCFPLFWIGFFIKDEYKVCADCGTQLGG